MRFEDQRKQLVCQILAPRGIKDPLVLQALLKVPREDFVPDIWKDRSYFNGPLPIEMGQTISQPYMVAIMMEALKLKESDIVLEIGTGSGYQTALLAEIVKEVYTIERHNDLLMSARKILKKHRYTNIHFKLGDGTLGWVNAIPVQKEFDRILVTAGAPHVPESLLAQLAEGGSLAIPVGQDNEQVLMIYEKHNGEISSTEAGGCAFVRLIGKEGWNQ